MKSPQRMWDIQYIARSSFLSGSEFVPSRLLCSRMRHHRHWLIVCVDVVHVGGAA